MGLPSMAAIPAAICSRGLPHSARIVESKVRSFQSAAGSTPAEADVFGLPCPEYSDIV